MIVSLPTEGIEQLRTNGRWIVHLIKVDQLASFRMVSGLMHVCMNKIQNIGKNAWGGDSGDSVGLKALRDTLPNRSGINTKKIDFYGWLRFMDAVLRLTHHESRDDRAQDHFGERTRQSLFSPW